MAVAATITAASGSSLSSCDTSSTSARSESSVTVTDGGTTVRQRSSVGSSSGNGIGSSSRYLFMVKLSWPTAVDKPSDATLVSMGRSACDADARGVSASAWTGAGDQSTLVFHSATAFLC